MIALTSLLAAPMAGAAEPSGPYRPITISGRIVTEEGMPVAGIRFMSAPTPSGTFGLPEVTLFLGVPPQCFTYQQGEATTGSDGRYQFTARFYPEHELRGRKCADYAAQLRAENLNLIPLQTAQYRFERATAALPVPRVNLRNSATPRNALPQPAIDPSRLRNK